jgi:hypothetical protein
MEVMTQPTVWVVGDWKQAEFGAAVEWIQARARCLSFEGAGTAAARLRAVEGLQAPTAIVLAQSRPGQMSRGDVERLHAAAPLARLVALVGAWCEGELRSGEPWPGVVRLPVGAWRCGLDQALGLGVANGRWRIPRTATAAERIEFSLTQQHRDCGRAATAVVCSSRRTNYEAIADMLQQVGVEPVWQSEDGGCGAAADVVLFDGWEHVGRVSQSEVNLPNGHVPGRILLLHFPREEDYARAAREGIPEVLKVPLLLPDLATALGIRRAAPGPLACASGLCE